MINNNLKKKLDDKKFVFTAETSPPDSADQNDVLKRVLCLKGVADAVNVTDGASAKSHLSSLVVSAILANNGIDPILQLTTRDRNRIAIQSDLLGGWALNIRNILCIFGDQVTSGDQPDAKEVRDLDSLGIIQTANQFKNEKVFPSGRKIQSAPEYFIAFSINEISFFTALLFALIGGLILNLMPCVFPVLSLKIFNFIEKSDSPKEVKAHGLIFAAGAILTFLLICSLILLFKYFVTIVNHCD